MSEARLFPRATRTRVSAAAAFALFMSAGASAAPSMQSEVERRDARRMQVHSLEVAAVPLFGDASLGVVGWGELAVRIKNQGKHAAEGDVVVAGATSPWRADDSSRVHAPYAVAAGASVTLRIPVKLSETDDPGVAVYDEQGRQLWEQMLSRNGDNRTLLVDVSQAPALGVALRGVDVGSTHDPWRSSHGGYPGSSAPADVVNALYDTTTGDPLLPRRAAGYARVAALLMRSEDLAGLEGPELEALAGWLLGGGTLALVMTRPEDLRDVTVMALVGGAIQKTSTVAIETMQELRLKAPLSSFPRHGSQPQASSPSAELAEQLVGHQGGNLRPSAYGASAAYGLGEVHVLAFDPHSSAGADSPWAHVRMIDLMRRANERTSGVLFRPGSTHTIVSEVRRQLDPNEGSRWAIVLSAILLCLYAVAAGPVNYTVWRKRHRPLRALMYLPILSVATFALVAIIGVIAKGWSGRARHLTVIEAGAGMKLGSARRWRGFFVPSSRQMTIHATNASSVLATERVSYGDEVHDELQVDARGMRVLGLEMLPWETEVVREDGHGSLGDGISILQLSSSESLVVNKTGRRLRGVVMWQPGEGALYLRTLDDGASVSTKRFESRPQFIPSGTTSPYGARIQELAGYEAREQLEDASFGLGDAWLAVTEALGGQRDWFPSTVPALIAQMDGGEGIGSDAGLALDSDRVLVRVVGWGGTP